jgi:hypothetical protein
MELAAILAWVHANQAALATVAFILSELLGAWPRVKANGIASFILLRVQEVLKGKGAVDPTP